jgi:hypothetical protein
MRSAATIADLRISTPALDGSSRDAEHATPWRETRT